MLYGNLSNIFNDNRRRRKTLDCVEIKPNISLSFYLLSFSMQLKDDKTKLSYFVCNLVESHGTTRKINLIRENINEKYGRNKIVDEFCKHMCFLFETNNKIIGKIYHEDNQKDRLALQNLNPMPPMQDIFPKTHAFGHHKLIWACELGTKFMLIIVS
jgi:hypothetical protein